MPVVAQPCHCCQVQPVWNRWTDHCFLCATTHVILKVGRFIWMVSEFKTDAPAICPKKPKPKLPKARVVKKIARSVDAKASLL